ncbi:MAG: DUF1738 domain-containing protein [Deltaproteobacteria bacterium]|nr:DUF1738 domain-containing protein [Deltaproteobacteria bacterium]
MPSTRNAPKTDLYQAVTDRIVAALEAGVAPWVCLWDRSGGQPHNGASGHVYKGVNVVMTGMSGYADPRWYTYRQAASLGGQVRRGEKGTTVIYWTFVEKPPRTRAPAPRRPRPAGPATFARPARRSSHRSPPGNPGARCGLPHRLRRLRRPPPLRGPKAPRDPRPRDGSARPGCSRPAGCGAGGPAGGRARPGRRGPWSRGPAGGGDRRRSGWRSSPKGSWQPGGGRRA